MKGFTIKVPASSANVGPGFDSIGMAINRYLTLSVSESEEWAFEHVSALLPSETNYETHFMYKIAKSIADKHNKTLPTCLVKVDSEIPLARGLGSSASAIVAGIELANQLCDLSLDGDTKLKYAVEIEGHPDNVAPALYGGFTISVQEGDEDTKYIKLPQLDLAVVVYIPDFELKTADARKVLPTEFTMAEATTVSGISNLMVAAFLTGDYELAGDMMERDLFHEKYRAKLIPNYDEIKATAKTAGAFGTVISGAGPTMISFVPKEKAQDIANKLKTLLPTYEVVALNLDYQGLQVK